MNLSSFERNMKNAENFSKGIVVKDGKSINRMIEKIYKFIQKKKKENPELTRDELLSEYDKFNERLVDAGVANADVLSYISEYNACLYLKQHPQKFKEINDYIEKNNLSCENDFFMHSNTFEENLINFTLLARHLTAKHIEETSDVLPSYLQNIISDNSKTPSKRDEEITKAVANFPIIQRKIILDVARIHLHGINYFMKDHDLEIERDLKDVLSESIHEIYSLLDDLGFIDDWMETENLQFAKCAIPELKIDKKTIDSQLSVQSLKGLKTTDLIGIHIMYVNRLFHVLENYSRAKFLIDEYNLEPILTDGETAPQLEREDIRFALIKMDFFYYPTDAYYVENDEQLRELEKKGELELDEDNTYSYSLEPLIEQVRLQYGKKYKEYFSELLPCSENDVGEDLSRYSFFANTIYHLKNSKNQSSLSLISLLTLYDDKSNYGIVLDNVSEDGTYGEVRHFTDFMVDINSVSPVNIHMNTGVLRDFMKEYLNTAIIPIYAGNEDWKMLDGKVMKSHLMMPWNKNLKKTIKTSSKANKRANVRTLNHLRALSDEKVLPIHLKASPKDKDIQRRYFNMDSNSILERVGGIYVKALPQGDTQGDDMRSDR